jgi:hypothetical protein
MTDRRGRDDLRVVAHPHSLAGLDHGLPPLEAIEWDVVRDLQGEEVIDDFSDVDRALWQTVPTAGIPR